MERFSNKFLKNNYLSSQVRVKTYVVPIKSSDTEALKHAALASPFLESVKVSTVVEGVEPGKVLVSKQVQVRSFLQDAKENAEITVTINNIFFIFLYFWIK